MPEYWQKPAKPEQEDDLDSKLIDELNEQADQTPKKSSKRKWSWLIRLVALLTVLAFSASALGIWPRLFNLPSLDFLTESDLLAQNPEVKSLQQAVFRVKTLEGQGTGFNIDPQGIVITNWHVVKAAKVIYVLTPQGATYNGELVASLPGVDLAVLKLKGEHLPVLPLTKTPLLRDDQVKIIGNPLGFPNVIVQGEVIGETLIKNMSEPVIMIKGTIHPGNSGSPVFNQAGKVAAVIFGSLKQGQANSEEMIGLAIPVSQIQSVLPKQIDFQD